MKKRCYVVDENNIIIIFYAHVLDEVCADFNCKESSHVVIKYYNNERDSMAGKNALYKIIPKDSAYYINSEG